MIQDMLLPACEGACTYCEPNGTQVMPFGGRSERAFTAVSVGVGPLFAPFNPTNYSGGKQMCSLGEEHNQQLSSSDDDNDGGTSHHRHKRLAGYGNDLSWRFGAREAPPSYSIGAGDADRAAVLEADGSAFIIGNATVTCGGYFGCEIISPVGNFTVLYTQNTSNTQYFQVYPAIDTNRVQIAEANQAINALNVTIQGLNSSVLAANITYLNQQVNMLWVVVNNITDMEVEEQSFVPQPYHCVG
jgi:hypothetical protein